MSYDITLIKDTVRVMDGKVDSLSLDLEEILKKLNDLSLRLARIEAKKK